MVFPLICAVPAGTSRWLHATRGSQIRIILHSQHLFDHLKKRSIFTTPVFKSAEQYFHSHCEYLKVSLSHGTSDLS